MFDRFRSECGLETPMAGTEDRPPQSCCQGPSTSPALGSGQAELLLLQSPLLPCTVTSVHLFMLVPPLPPATLLSSGSQVVHDQRGPRAESSSDTS